MTMKRSLSDSDSDDCFDDCKDGSPGQSCHMSDRKKRRGIIEKRRRDRINNSLSELRRLVPAAFEKQGSAKLEKAEILQMTVDHLKVLHQKGSPNSYNYTDPSLAMDYRSVGFRECAAEVARYLVAMEGLDIQDPLRLRLLSHLQCFSAQREAPSKPSFQNNNWGTVTPHHHLNSQYNPTSMTSMLSQPTDHLGMTAHSSSLTSVTCPEPRLSTHSLDRVHSLERAHSLDRQHSLDQHHPSSLTRLPSISNMTPQMPSVSSSSLPGLSQVPSQFPTSLGMNSLPMLSPSGAHYSSTAALGQSVPLNSKPYRPWGSELAY